MRDDIGTDEPTAEVLLVHRLALWPDAGGLTPAEFTAVGVMQGG